LRFLVFQIEFARSTFALLGLHYQNPWLPGKRWSNACIYRGHYKVKTGADDHCNLYKHTLLDFHTKSNHVCLNKLQWGPSEHCLAGQETSDNSFWNCETRLLTLSCSSEPGSLPAAAYKTKTQWREMIHADVTGCKGGGTSLWKLQPLQKVLLSIASQVCACCNKNFHVKTSCLVNQNFIFFLNNLLCNLRFKELRLLHNRPWHIAK
jgi:hypothetical protein